MTDNELYVLRKLQEQEMRDLLSTRPTKNSKRKEIRVQTWAEVMQMLAA